MHPPFGPFARGTGCRRGGARPFIVQFLRAPLTLNNIIALAITVSVQRKRQADLDVSSPCAFIRSDGGFGILAILFAASIVHNVMSVVRFHKIKRQVFGQTICQARRQWRERGQVMFSEEDMEDIYQKVDEMARRIPSLFISLSDVALAGAFLGIYVLMTFVSLKQEKVPLGAAYASIGALVAFLFNMIIGFSGLKFWVRARRDARESPNDSPEDADVKTNLLG